MFSLVMHRPGGHGPDFKKACHILGVHPDFTKAGGKLTPEMFGPEKALSHKADKMIRTVQKLLSLAGSDNENEAGSASRKANELIRKHNLDLFRDENQLHRHKAAYLVITHKKKQITRLQKSNPGHSE